VLPAVAANPATSANTTARTKARVKPALMRQPRNADATPGARGGTSAESRLGAWDPDSPVPP
jgi:hypothetical protein